ncbi:unnamed protein product, partial [Didymodactylos carnosus]
MEPISNSDARNAAFNNIAPIFLATNHQNYVCLSAQHLLDLHTCAKSLFQILSKCFAVRRATRPFSTIGMDQTIECTINKMGKGHGGISGRFRPELVDIWPKTFTFRTLLKLDEEDLTLILSKLNYEKLYSCENDHVAQLLSGKLIHDDIVTMYVLINSLVWIHYISEDRPLNLSSLFSYEFAKFPISLCGSNNPLLMNQQ